MNPEPPHPEDQRLVEAFGALDPTPERERAVEAALMKALEERPPSLVSEWLDLLLARPVVNTAYLLAAAAVLLFATPLGSLASLLARAARVGL